MRLVNAMTFLALVAGCGPAPSGSMLTGTDVTASWRSEEGNLRSQVPGPSLGLPVAAMADVSAINDAFSLSAACPWGFAHAGIDFVPEPPTSSLMPVVAAQAGKVLFVEPMLNGVHWQVNVGIEHAPDFRAEYIFETFSSSASDRDAQVTEVLVTVGRTVGRGQRLGRLVAAGSGAHVHFGLRKNNVDVCPAPYFIPKVRNEILAKLRETWPGAELCYT